MYDFTRCHDISVSCLIMVCYLYDRIMVACILLSIYVFIVFVVFRQFVFCVALALLLGGCTDYEELNSPKLANQTAKYYSDAIIPLSVCIPGYVYRWDDRFTIDTLCITSFQ